MSTRSNIFVDFNGERKQFYHHCDGYLDGVGKDLLIRMAMAIKRARKAIPYSLKDDNSGLRTERAYKEFFNLLEEEGYYAPEEIGLHRDIEYLYYVEFSPKGNRVTYSRIEWQKLKEENYRQNLETAKCGDYILSFLIKKKKEIDDEQF